MTQYIHVPQKGDPSTVQQLFSNLSIQLLCCRYWWLKHWESSSMSFPYWRIYWNTTPGGFISFKGKSFELLPGKIFLISPNTPFSTYIDYPSTEEVDYRLEGGRVEGDDAEEKLYAQGVIRHLFLHFNIGMPYDFVSPNIFVFDITTDIKYKIDKITTYLRIEHERFNFHTTLIIHSLISELLSLIPEKQWSPFSVNSRIQNVLHHIEINLNKNLSNDVLALKSDLATNAFTRLFRNEIGVSPQQFVKKRRIDHACMLLNHTDITIDEVASKTGFADRYHFSRIFKSITGYSPARYKKGFGLK